MLRTCGDPRDEVCRARTAELTLETAAARTNALDPSVALARGWSITRGPDGAVVRSVADVSTGAELTTQVADGTITSTIASDE